MNYGPFKQPLTRVNLWTLPTLTSQSHVTKSRLHLKVLPPLILWFLSLSYFSGSWQLGKRRIGISILLFSYSSLWHFIVSIAEEQHHAQWSVHPRAINFGISQAGMHLKTGWCLLGLLYHALPHKASNKVIYIRLNWYPLRPHKGSIWLKGVFFSLTHAWQGFVS